MNSNKRKIKIEFKRESANYNINYVKLYDSLTNRIILSLNQSNYTIA
jgi:hypothetical protein